MALLRFSFLLLMLLPNLIFAVNNLNRLGIGASQQLGESATSLSFKLQKSQLYSFGLLLGASNSKTSSYFLSGLKIYRNLYDEPSLTFYSSLLVGVVTQKRPNGKNYSGLQLDATVGPEFHLPALQSIGFSFEVGLSLKSNASDGTTFQTAAYHFIQGGIHFYL